MLYDTSSLMKCQVKKYSGLNFARKIRYVAPDVSSKIWYCGTSIGLTYDGLIASANFCKFLSTLSLRRATSFHAACPFLTFISIHALLAESD